jgi:hypothetical protein
MSFLGMNIIIIVPSWDKACYDPLRNPDYQWGSREIKGDGGICLLE